jgi:hypothetical protein
LIALDDRVIEVQWVEGLGVNAVQGDALGHGFAGRAARIVGGEDIYLKPAELAVQSAQGRDQPGDVLAHPADNIGRIFPGQ